MHHHLDVLEEQQWDDLSPTLPIDQRSKEKEKPFIQEITILLKLSSMRVYNKPIYDEDIIIEVSRAKSLSSTMYVDVVSTSSPVT